MGTNTRFFGTEMTKINEDIKRNRGFWNFENYPKGYIGHPVRKKYNAAYGGCLHLVVERLIEPYIHSDSIVLEIGPGNGKWTQFFTKAKEVICVDIIDLEKILREYFPDMNLKFFTLENDIKLDFLKDHQIDYIFSFDTFVHLAPECIEAYFKEFYRILKFEGCGIIHYSDWEKYKLFKNEYPDEKSWPKNDLTQMKSHIKNSDLTLITWDTKLLLRDRILVFTKKNERK